MFSIHMKKESRRFQIGLRFEEGFWKGPFSWSRPD